MTGPQHSSGEGLGRSTASAAGRGALLLIVAVVIGVVLLNHFDRGDPFNLNAGATTAATRASRATTTVAAPTTTVALRAPNAVKVLAANGSGVSGVGAKLKDQLTQLGYNALAATNATPTNKVFPTSLVQYAPGFAGEAAALAQSLSLPPTAVQPMSTPPPVADSKGADVIVVVGQDLASRIGASTPTTVHRTWTATTVHTATTRTATTVRSATTKAPTTTKAA